MHPQDYPQDYCMLPKCLKNFDVYFRLLFFEEWCSISKLAVLNNVAADWSKSVPNKFLIGPWLPCIEKQSNHTAYWWTLVKLASDYLDSLLFLITVTFFLFYMYQKIPKTSPTESCWEQVQIQKVLVLGTSF